MVLGSIEVASVLVDVFSVTDYDWIEFMTVSSVEVFSQHVVDDVSQFSFLLDLNGGIFDFNVLNVFLGTWFESAILHVAVFK